MRRVTPALLATLIALTLVSTASGEDKLKRATYTVTTKNLSVALSAHSSIPLTLGYWTAEGAEIEVTSVEGSTAGLQ